MKRLYVCAVVVSVLTLVGCAHQDPTRMRASADRDSSVLIQTAAQISGEAQR